MIPSIPFLIVCFGALFALFAGIGLAIRRWTGLGSPARIDDVFVCFWTGLAGAIFFLQIWHLFFPVNMPAFAVVALWGGTGLARHLLWLRQQPRLTKKQRKVLGDGLPAPLGWSFYVPVLVFAWLVAFYAVSLPMFYDAGLYYLPTMRWVTSFPVVPGLGNLHARLAYNQSYFLYLGLLEAWTGRGTHLANSTLILVGLAQFWLSFLRVLRPVSLPSLAAGPARDPQGYAGRPAGRRRPVDIFQALMLPFLLHQVFLVFLASPTPDMCVMILAVLSTSLLIRILENNPDGAEELPWLLYSLAGLLLLGVTTKLTFSIFGLTALLILLIGTARARWKTLGPRPGRLLRSILFLALFAFIPWFAHGIMLTGYIAYPLPYGRLNVDWRLPLSSLEYMRFSVMDYAREDWARRPDKHIYVTTPLVLAAIGLIANAIAFVRTRRRGENGILWLVPLPCIVTIVHWYLQVPNLRFGYAFFSILPGVFLMLWLRTWANPSKIVAGYLFLFAAVILIDVAVDKKFDRTAKTNRIMTEKLKNVWRLDKASWLTQQDYLPYVTRSGLMLFVPVKDDRCWDTNEICTPYPRRDLRLRRPGDLGRGFRVEPFDETDKNVGFTYKRTIPSLSEV
ncbi:MAG: LIC_10190 family membrane protein [Deltaproteobacteria bacterium]